MSRNGLFIAAVFAGIVGTNAALAQGVPPRLQGDYAIGPCTAPQVSATIDGSGMRIYDPQSGETFADVEALAVNDGGGVVEMDVVLNGNEDGTLTVTVRNGTIDVVYQPDGGAAEEPATLELCAAAEVPDEPQVTGGTTVPDALLGEWVTGSCDAPRDRLVIDPGSFTAYDQGSPNPTGVVDVVGVEEFPGGYLIDGDFQGQQIGIELTTLGPDALEMVFIGPGGGRDAPQELMRCTAPEIDTPAAMAPLPDVYLGRYAIGEGASCAAAASEVIFSPTELTLYEDGAETLVIEVVGVVATEPDLVFDVLAGSQAGQVTMRRTGDATYEVVFTDTQGNADQPQTFIHCDAASPVEEGPIEEGPVATAGEIPAAWLGVYAFDGGTCADAAAGSYIAFEPTRLVVFDSGQQAFEVAVTGVTATDPDLVLKVDVPGEGAGELAMRHAGGNSYDVTLSEEGGANPDTDVFIRCDAADVDVPVEGPVVAGEPGTSTPTVPDAWLGRYAFGTDAALCGPADAGEYLVFEPTRLVMMTDGREEMIITVLAAHAGAERLVLDVVEERMGAAEIAFDPVGDGVYDVTVTEPDGSTEHETIVACGAGADLPVDEPIDEPVDQPVDEPVAYELPAAYLGRYVLDYGALGCDSTEGEVIFEPTRLLVYENGTVEVEIEVLAVLATEPDLVFSATVAGQGDAEITVRAIGGDEYEVVVLESGSDSADTETLLYCPAAADAPADQPADGPLPAEAGDLTQFLFDQSAAEFAAFMATLESTCVDGGEQACLDAFFGFADVTGDGLLTQAELARLTRYGTKWAASQAMMMQSADGGTTDGLTEGQKLALHLATMVTGPLVADGLIYNFDYDGNRALSQAELFPDGVDNAPLAVDALLATFTEDTIEQVLDALEVLDDLM